MVAESDLFLEVCILMNTEAVLAKQVDLILTTMSGTGKHLLIPKLMSNVYETCFRFCC